MKQNEAIIGMGSNIEPGLNIQKALDELGNIAKITAKSEFHYTKPLIFKEQADFLNGAVLVHTEYNYEQLKELLNKIEKRLGRIRTENKNGPRTIDLDIIIFNNQVTDNLFFEREFLQKAIFELKPEFQSLMK